MAGIHMRRVNGNAVKGACPKGSQTEQQAENSRVSSPDADAHPEPTNDIVLHGKTLKYLF